MLQLKNRSQHKLRAGSDAGPKWIRTTASQGPRADCALASGATSLALALVLAGFVLDRLPGTGRDLALVIAGRPSPFDCPCR
jgi:hypothetical protein